MSGDASAQATSPEDIRPVVRTSTPGNFGLWAFGAILLLGGLLLFQALSSRRENLTVPVTGGATSGTTMAAPPPLVLPDAYREPGFGPLVRVVPAPPIVSPLGPGRLPAAFPPQAITRVTESPPLFPSVASPAPTQPVLAMPQPSALPPIPTPLPGPPAQTFDPEERVTAGRLVNPALTIPRGTIVAAVMETALDSSRPGAARAIVSRDVKSFDGSRVLIPRGSRLYGEYEADVSSGQRRALVRWQRLLRPDGVTIDLDSPSADPLGRAGVEGKVNTHFFARFSSAILQSVLDIGVGLATRSVSDNGVIVALPGSTQQITGQAQQAQVQPTLRVRQGTSVSVFVARDLDFSTVDG